MPALPPNLLSLLVQNMPHRTRDRDAQCLYMRAAFALAEGPAGGPIRDGLLVGVVEHLLTVDVEIRWEAIVDVKNGAITPLGPWEYDVRLPPQCLARGRIRMRWHARLIRSPSRAGAHWWSHARRWGWERDRSLNDHGRALHV